MTTASDESPGFERLLAHTEAYDPTTGRRMVFRSAAGAVVTDREGRAYLDFVNGDGAVTLGHADPRVAEAVYASLLRSGSLVTGPNEDVVAVMDLLGRRLDPEFCFAFFSSGSEAMLAVASGYRDRDARPLVLSAGYHGWPPLWRASPALLEPNASGVIDFFFDLELLEEAIRRHGDRVGLVCLSPDHVWLDRGWYEGFFSLVARLGAVVCCDDSMQGYRGSPGPSLHAWLERIDVIAMGKGLSNGGRMSVVATRPGRLPLLPDINSSVAYETMSFAAARATLQAYEDAPVQQEIRARGDAFLARLRPLIEASPLPVELFGNGSVWQLVFAHDELEQATMKACFRRGVLLAPFDTQKPSHAMTEEHYAAALEALEGALHDVEAEGLPEARATLGPGERALSASYVLHGVAPLPGLNARDFVSRVLLPRTSAGGLIMDSTELRAGTMWAGR